ncbi:MAG TPA: hypothetical protein VE476_11365 [Propionibacteriaceae bacterium]|jgi:hypothetical protein|nr:hypothetical protein [Propionibacteriaceae bacterium]
MIVTRAYITELEVREDQRQIVGVAVPYGVQIRVGRYLETFRPGAFADPPARTAHRHPPPRRRHPAHRYLGRLTSCCSSAPAVGSCAPRLSSGPP